MKIQEMFDTVVSHLRKQNRKAIDPHSDLCQYFVPLTDDKCAVGCLIPPKMYRTDMEGDLGNLLARYSQLQYYWLEDWDYGDSIPEQSLYNFLRDCQGIHDKTNPSQWEQGFRSLSQKYNLVYTPPFPG